MLIRCSHTLSDCLSNVLLFDVLRYFYILSVLVLSKKCRYRTTLFNYDYL